MFGGAHAPATLAVHRGQVQVHARSSTTTSEDRIATQSIDDLSGDYCNDFECTSSPSVELGVRSFARDLTRLRYSPSLFNKDVTYSDGFRSFTGSGNYGQPTWYSESLTKPTVSIIKMRMLNKGTAQIEWRVVGSLGAVGAVDIGATTVIELNLLTGRIASHRETWDVSRLSAPAKVFATLGRALWSLKRGSADAGAGMSKKASDALSKMSGDEDTGLTYHRDPTDPTRFFSGNQGDSQFNDYISFALMAAMLWLAFKVYGELLA